MKVFEYTVLSTILSAKEGLWKRLAVLMIASGFLLTHTTTVLAKDTIHIAVAANFLATMKTLSKTFNQQTGIKVIVSNGATGMLYAQIKRGAPYDLFFAADAKRPALLEQQGLIEPNSRFTYVMGRLVIWSPNADKVSPDLNKFKKNDPNVRFFAIANPKIAPYGVAARAVLQHYGLYQSLSDHNQIVLGENIGKTFHYIASGNAQIGLVAKSYVSNPKQPVKGQFREIDAGLYPKIEQQAVIIKGKASAAVRQFLAFFQSPSAQQQIQRYGYGLPNESH